MVMKDPWVVSSTPSNLEKTTSANTVPTIAKHPTINPMSRPPNLESGTQPTRKPAADSQLITLTKLEKKLTFSS